jgi:hypothetical protein
MNGDSRPQSRILMFLWKCARYVCVILLADAAVIAATSILLGRNLLHYFTLLTLSEAGMLFLAGGAVEWGHTWFTRIKKEKRQSFDQHEKTKLRVATYIAVGTALFLVSYLLSYPLN